MEEKKTNLFIYGLKKGIPIALAYLAVSFAFGVMMKSGGLTPLTLTIMSLLNFSSAGELAGAKMILEVASYFEIFITVLFINLRYALMSISLSQKISSDIPRWKRLIMSFGITDENYALMISEEKEINLSYVLGLTTITLFSWVLGTLLGSLGANIFPERVLFALNIALYSMLIAIITPDAKKNYKILIVILIAISLSCVFYYVPVIKEIGLGFKIIISSFIASIVGAFFFMIKSNKEEDE